SSGTAACRGDAGGGRPVLRYAARSHHSPDGTTQTTCPLSLSRICNGRWADELRSERLRSLSLGGYLCRKDSQWHKANRPPGDAIGQIRACDQFEDRQGACLRRARQAARDRRRGDRVKRRDFITLLGGAAATWPLSVRAQQTKVARIGFLGLVSASSHAARLAALRAGLRDRGWLEGTNLLIEYRWAEGDYKRLRGLAEELVQLKVDVLVTHASPGALAAKSATSTIPIVLTAVGDIVALGLISSLSLPGGNITGLSTFTPEVTAKR